MDRSGFEPEASCLQSPKTLPPASKYSKELRKWMDQKGFSQGYRNDILRYLKPTENKEIQGITELREIVSGSSSSMVLTVFRAYINFLLDTEIITEEDAIYIKEYLEERRKQGEELTYESPLLQFDVRGVKKNAFLRTTLVTRDIREAIEQAGLKMRPYVLRAYFSTALDIAESKGMISHPWRQFIMGHKGDIEARYSTNKRLPPDMIEEMRESYKKCLKYMETRVSEVSEENARLYLQQQLLSAVGYRQDEIDKMNLADLNTEDFQKLLRDKVAGAMASNGSKQKLVPMNEIEKLLSEGYEFQAVLPNGKAIMKIPF